MLNYSLTGEGWGRRKLNKIRIHLSEPNVDISFIKVKIKTRKKKI